MSWFFFVDASTGRLVAIVMSDGRGITLSARFGVNLQNHSIEDYWQNVNADFLNQLLNGNIELYEYDLDSEELEPNADADLDPSDELSWKIPPVQQWVRGAQLHREQVETWSHFIGFGSGFIAEDIIAGEIYDRIHGVPNQPTPSNAQVNLARCLWCMAPVERRYNFERNAPLNQPDVEHFENPIVWSDGVVTEAGESDAKDSFPNHYGDCVVACSACGAMFLASTFEKQYPRKSRYPDHERWHLNEALIFQGSCLKGTNEHGGAQAFLTWATLEQTMEFLTNAQSAELINWDQWTALQQAVNWVSYEDRQAKLEGNSFSFTHSADLKKAIKLFLKRISQIKEGSLGSMSPFWELHLQEIRDENFFVHNYGVQEILPIANMMRITGDSQKMMLEGERFFEWARPNHPAINEPEVTSSGWSEFDQWIALRSKAIIFAANRGIRDWAVAVDQSGNLIDQW